MDLEPQAQQELKVSGLGMTEEKVRALLFLAEKLNEHRDVVMRIILRKTGGVLKMDKGSALSLLLEKMSAPREATGETVCEKASFVQKLDKTRVLPICLLAAGLLLHSQGYCNDASGLDSITNNVMQIVFGSAVRKSLLVLAAAWGVFQAATSGSFKPVLFWGGIGLAIAYVPKLVEIIANVG